jgi:hypothetical protein
VALSYGPAGQKDAVTVRPAGFQPGPHTLVDHIHDLRSQPIRAFSSVEFYWTITDSRGHHLTTTPQTFVYEDNRFQWEPPLSAEGVTVFWYDRPEQFGRTALYVAQQARKRIMIDMGGDPRESLKLYIYASASDLLGAIPVDRKEWVVGQAYPDTGVCLVVIPEDKTESRELERVIPHEISHLLLGTISPHPPFWLDEGLATQNEGVSDPYAEALMDAAVVRDQLIPFQELCTGFPTDSRQAGLAYTQSRSLVAFIRERYGQEGLQRLINAYQDAGDCQSGVQEALGMSLSSLEDQWKASLPQERSLHTLLQSSGPWIVLWLGSLIVALLLIQPALGRFKRWFGRRLKVENAASDSGQTMRSDGEGKAIRR